MIVVVLVTLAGGITVALLFPDARGEAIGGAVLPVLMWLAARFGRAHGAVEGEVRGYRRATQELAAVQQAVQQRLTDSGEQRAFRQHAAEDQTAKVKPLPRPDRPLAEVPTVPEGGPARDEAGRADIETVVYTLAAIVLMVLVGVLAFFYGRSTCG